MTTEKRKSCLIVKLGIMLFLQFFIWGSWFLTIPNYVATLGAGFDPYWAYSAGPIAAMIAPFFLGLIADRFFDTEKLLSILFILAGVFMFFLPIVANMEGSVENRSSLFNTIILLHMICYMPTLALTASLSFKHLPKGSSQFPIVRLWGTFGWIFAGILLPYLFNQYVNIGGETKISLAAEKTVGQFHLAGYSAIALGIFCWFLPKTVAPKKGDKINFRDLFFLDVWKEFKVSSFAIFVTTSFLVCIPLQAYYAYLQTNMETIGLHNISIWKNIGTWIEAFMMFGMPFLFIKLGVKKMITIGITAWVIRYALFGLASNYGIIEAGSGVNLNGFEIPFKDAGFLLIIGGVALHGLCYDFFFVTGQVYVDQVTDSKIRGQAQSMLVFFTQGLGMYVGAEWVNKKLFSNAFPSENPYTLATNTQHINQWGNFWYLLMCISIVILVIFVIAFKPKKDKVTEVIY